MSGKKDKKSLENSKHFCMLPWMHLHFWPDSSAHLCCISDSSRPVSRYEGDLKSVINSESMKRIRQNMLNDLPSPECNRCYELEKNGVYSLRNNSNKKYIRYFEDVSKTHEDGSVDQFIMRYLDVRFSNMCNFRCRSCGPQLSTAWYEDNVKMYPNWKDQKNHKIGPEEKFWNDLLPSLDHIEEAYFAGGEPLITDEIYRIMDYWIENDITDIEINFTTNFSRLSFKNKNIIDYWKHFPQVTVSASLDDSGPRAEYMRKGTRWDQIVENRKRMLAECPEVNFEITPTISVFNIFHFPEFHYEWLKNGFLTPENIRMNILTAPSSMSFQIIHPNKRKLLKEKWLDYLDMIVREFNIDYRYYHKVISAYKSILTALEDPTHLQEKNQFFERNNLVDELRQESLYDTFPELKNLLAD